MQQQKDLSKKYQGLTEVLGHISTLQYLMNLAMGSDNLESLQNLIDEYQPIANNLIDISNLFFDEEEVKDALKWIVVNSNPLFVYELKKDDAVMKRGFNDSLHIKSFFELDVKKNFLKEKTEKLKKELYDLENKLYNLENKPTDTPNLDLKSLKKERDNYKRRLRILKEQEALEGITPPPKLIMDIENAEQSIKDLNLKIKTIEGKRV